MSGDAFAAGAFVVLGGFFVILGVVDLIGGLKSRNWDVVSGEIIECRRSTGYRSKIVVDIRYQYTIEGFTYEGDRFGFGKLTSFVTPSAAERAVSMYPKGRVVKLFVSPSDRSSAVLEPGVGRGVVMMVLTGALLAAGGVAALLG